MLQRRCSKTSARDPRPLAGRYRLRFTTDERRQAAASPVFKTPDGWVPLDRTAYGYQTLFVWVLDLVARLFEHYPDSDEPLKEPAVVLVDEIELHLHPKMAAGRAAVFDKTFPNVQFVVTTHSPLVAQAAPEVGANIAVLRRERDADGKGPVVIDDSRGRRPGVAGGSGARKRPVRHARPRPKAQQDGCWRSAGRSSANRPSPPRIRSPPHRIGDRNRHHPAGRGPGGGAGPRRCWTTRSPCSRTAVAEAEAERAANETPAEPPAPADDPAGRPKTAARSRRPPAA